MTPTAHRMEGQPATRPNIPSVTAGRGLSGWCPGPTGTSTDQLPLSLTWVQDGLDDVPVPPLGLHALQLLGLVPLAALLLLLLSGVLWGAEGGSAEARGSAPPSQPPPGSPPGSGLSFL